MITLSLETATHTGGAALLDGDILRGSVTFTTRTLYSQRLMPSINELLTRTEIVPSDIDLIAVSIGPGSFTGLRIGLSVAKGLALGCDSKIIGVKTLEALALRASYEADSLPVCCIMDARQGQIYSGLYKIIRKSGSPGSIVAVREDFAGPLAEISDWITSPTIFAGDAVSIYNKELHEMLGDHFIAASALHRLPHPEEVAWVGASRYEQSGGDSLMGLEPHYVRRSYMASTTRP